MVLCKIMFIRSIKLIIAVILILFAVPGVGLSAEPAEAVSDGSSEGVVWSTAIAEAVMENPMLPWRKHFVKEGLQRCSAGGIAACVELGLGYQSIRINYPDARLRGCVAGEIFLLACRRGSPAGCYMAAWELEKSGCTYSFNKFSYQAKLLKSGCTPMAEDTLKWSVNKELARSRLTDFATLCDRLDTGEVLVEVARGGGAQTSRPANLSEEEQKRLDSALFVKVALGPRPERKALGFDEKTGRLIEEELPASSQTTADLVMLGADPNAVSSDGTTPLMEAVKHVRFDSVSALLSIGADVNIKDSKGRSVIIIAASQQSSDTKIIDTLISFGADVNEVADSGITPLMAAVIASNVRSVKTLLSSGADVNASDFNGDTIYKIAMDIRRENVSSPLLKERRAEIEELIKNAPGRELAPVKPISK
ncbi:MAG: ankyrin repeat domain-containing protein [Thermodesulfobacteriota bacterium]